MLTPFLDLIQNVALLLAIALIFDVAQFRPFKLPEWIQRLLLGIAIGVIGVTIMLTHWVFIPGIIFDTRSIALVISGLFFGTIPTVIAMVITAAFRLYLGGAAVWTGISVILMSGLLGIVVRHYRRRPLADISVQELYLLGVIAHVIMLLLMLTLPGDTARTVLSAISLPVLILYPLGTVLLGHIMANRLRRARAQALLADSERRYRFLAENISDVIWIYNLDTGQCEYVSPSVERLRGFTVDEVMHQNLEQVIVDMSPSAVQEKLAQRIHEVMSGERGHVYIDEVQQTCKDGSTVWTEVSTQITRDEAGHLSLLGVNRNITERRRSEEALREQEKRLQLVLEGAEAGYWDWNIQTGETTFSEFWAKMLGYELSKLTPHMETWRELVHPDDIAKVMDILNRHVRGESKFYEAEYRILAKDGSWRWILDRGKVMEWDSEGRSARAAGTYLDVTERKKIEQALVESEKRFRLLIEQSPFPTAVFAADGTLLDGNPALRSRWKLPQDTSVEFGSYNILKSKRAHDLMMDGYLQKAFSGEQVVVPPYESDVSLTFKELGIEVQGAEKRWIRSHYYPITDSTDTLINVVLVHEDITDVKRADDALKAAQDRYEKAFYSSPIAMNVVNLVTGERLEVNDRYMDLSGYSQEEVIDHTLASLNMFVSSEERETMIRILLSERQVYDYPVKIMTKQGEVKDLLGSGAMIDSEVAGLAILSWIDVTERNRTTESLRQLNQAIEQSPVSVIITDLAGSIRYVNPKFCEVTGYTTEETIGQNPRILRSGTHSQEFYKQMWDTITTGRTWKGELCNRKKDGTLYWESASIAGVRDTNGLITHYVAVKEDITERRRIGEAHAHQERLAAVGQLAAGIAHDFNNIMGVIVIYAQMLNHAEEIPERFRERASIIYQQAKNASQLVQQILDFSRQSNLERQPLNLVPMLKEQVKLLERTLPEHIQIHFESTEEEYMVSADPGRLQQMLTNLAINVRDAMPTGGNLYIELSNVCFNESDVLPTATITPGRWIKLSVADTGKGMSEEVIKHIFEPFFTTKERGRGTGLGLAQVYGIVKQHDGYIDVKSRVGEGSTFEIYLPPLLQMEQDEVKFDDVVEMPNGAERRILLVEDDKFLRPVMAELLSNWHYVVFTAANGVEAVEILADENGAFDLVMSDFIMPHMGGAALLEHIHERYPHLPVVFITGHPIESDKAELEALGLRKWLYKPVDILELAKTVAHLLGAPSSS